MRYRRRRPNYQARVAAAIVFVVLSVIGGTLNGGCAPVQPTSFVSTYP